MSIPRVGNSVQTFGQAHPGLDGNPQERTRINNHAGRNGEEWMRAHPLGNVQNRGSRFHDIRGILPIAAERANVINTSITPQNNWARNQANLSSHPVDIVDKFGKAAMNVKKTYESYTPVERATVGAVLAGGAIGAAALTGISCFIGEFLNRLVR